MTPRLLLVALVSLAGLLPPGQGSRAAAPGGAALLLGYTDFGPQAVAHELLGMEWWQWQPHGAPDPLKRYPIRVVVHRGMSEARARRIFPVDRTRERILRRLGGRPGPGSR